MISRIWQNLNLAQRLVSFFGSGMLTFGLLLLVNFLYHETTYIRHELAQRLVSQTELLALSIIEPVVVGDYAQIEQMLELRAKHPGVARITWTDVKGAQIIKDGTVAPSNAPELFQRLVDISLPQRTESIVVGGAHYGQVAVLINANVETNTLWGNLCTQLELLLLCIGVLLAISLAIVTNGLRPLYELAAAARRLGLGDHSVRVRPSGPPEMQTTSRAFNQMAESLVQDMQRQKQSEAALLKEKNLVAWHASHDALTGLANRREFEHRLEQLVQNADSGGGEHSLLYLDLDQIKIVNDTCGHVAGDQLLRQIATALQQGLRSSDTLARLGGDEFGILLPGCNLIQATNIAEGRRKKLAELPFVWDGRVFRVTASIGVSCISGSGHTSLSVLAEADTACYAAKDKGRNRIQAYRPDDRELATRSSEMQWVSRLNDAFTNERFRLHFQRIIPLQGSAKARWYEVLLRIADPSGELIPPMTFIPAAERYNMMSAIDFKVIELALAMHQKHATPEQPLRLFINLSGATLGDEELVDFVRRQFALSKVPPQSICFEITETAAIANLSRAAKMISELKTLGCQFSLDDFGSGFSSFAYLKTLPVDYLKIDGNFVRTMTRNPIDRAMVKAINDIGHLMGISTIAEFVEDDATLVMLQSIGVNHAQGFAIARPVAEITRDAVAHQTPRVSFIGSPATRCA